MKVCLVQLFRLYIFLKYSIHNRCLPAFGSLKRSVVRHKLIYVPKKLSTVKISGKKYFQSFRSTLGNESDEFTSTNQLHKILQKKHTVFL